MADRWLLELAVKSTFVLLLACTIASWCGRRWSAATRHLTWTVAVIAVLYLPVASAFGPQWAMPVPQWWSSAPAPADPSGGGAGQSRVASASSNATSAAAGVQAPVTVDVEALFPAAKLQDRPHEFAAAVPYGRLWLAGLGVMLLRFVGGLLWVSAVVRRARPVLDPDWHAEAAKAAAALGVRRPVPLLFSDAIGVPAVAGLFRPALLMPTEGEGWTREQRQSVLLHEFAHVRRRDGVVQFLASLASFVYWWNPLVHVAARRLRAEQEHACDDLVLRVGVSGPAYASHLCDIVERSRRARVPLWLALAMGRRSRLEPRVRAVLDTTRVRAVPSRRARFGWVAVMVVSATSLATVRAVRTPVVDAFAPTAGAGIVHIVPVPLASRALPGAAILLPQRGSRLAPIAPTPTVLPPSEARVFLTEYCVACHNATRKTANVVLDATDPDDVGSRAGMWEQVVRRLRSGTHPPPGRPRADRLRSDAFVTFVETALDRLDAANWTPDVAERLTNREVAARLAAFLWGTDADAELDQLAAKGALANAATLQQQVGRMLKDARATALVTGFFGQWLYLRNMARVSPDTTAYPEFDESLREAFRRETELFLESQVRGDRPVTELLTANYTFVNERLARHYGLTNVSGPEFRRVTMNDDARAGLLGQGSILTVTSYAHRTSPVLRGKFVLETLFGAPPPPPPPNVPRLPENDPDHPTTMRARLENAVKAPVCASCHTLMDPLGLALENFDAVGRWRETEGGLPIDASGAFDDTRFTGPADFRIALLQRSDAFVRTVTERLLSYAIGLPTRAIDMPAVRTIVHEAALTNHRWSALITRVVLSTPFQMKRVP